ncbi:unnamed protein product [Trichobilharzia regenti]|nr:unnamed protein product [Trichobilharzia regenti]
MIQLPRYTKAAGEQGSKVWLTCFIRTEPAPQIAWLKGGKLIPMDLLIPIRELDVTKSVKKYESFLTHIRPGLYKAQLALNDIRKSDFGSYVCQAANMQGEAQLGIHLSGTSTPDVPLNLRLLNATSTTLQVAWTQGFDGGSAQTFQIRWREIGSVSLYKYADVASNDNRNGVEYVITGIISKDNLLKGWIFVGIATDNLPKIILNDTLQRSSNEKCSLWSLKPGTEYTVSVNSNNAKHGASAYTEPVNLRTLSCEFQILTSLCNYSEWMIKRLVVY